jgi:DNA-binding transcriptional ArsR family regulator
VKQVNKRLSSRECAKVLRALAEGIRLEIILCLFNGESSVSEIAKKIGKNHSQVSHHLGVLRNSGLVVDKKDGKFVIYQVRPILYRRFKGSGDRNILDFECCSIEFRNRNLEKYRE